MSFAHMKTMIDLCGGNIRQTKINEARFIYEHEFDKDISYQPNFMMCVGVDADHELPIRTWHDRYSAANGFTCQFATKLTDKVVVGDLLYDFSNDRYWLCEESYNKDEVYWQGKLTRCNELRMRWQDKDKNVLEYPVFAINSTQYNSGESGDKTIVLGSSQHLITIIADKNTLALNHGKRFFWDRYSPDVIPTVFRITQNDTTTKFYDKGLLQITCMEDQFNPNTDSIENWICDYFDVDKQVVIIHSGSADIRIGGIKTLRVETEQEITWMIDDATGITLTPSGNTIKVKCDNDMSLINQTRVLTAELADGSKGTCTLTIIGGV